MDIYEMERNRADKHWGLHCYDLIDSRFRCRQNRHQHHIGFRTHCFLGINSPTEKREYSFQNSKSKYTK